ncbi:MAG: 23S rRNA (adenine(2503)-C(2))-methyltransferase RlmN [Deltaproteobacteria bacterium]
MSKVNIKNLSPGELQGFVAEFGEKPYRAAQLGKWIYQRRAASFDEMTDVSKGFRQTLNDSAEISALALAQELVSSDGTKKYLFELRDGNRIESVLIPANDRNTLCVSSQVGCAIGCRFCLTARVGRVRNLEASEIINQFMQVNAWNSDCITNIVFMGMGEPLDNLDNLVRALEILTNPNFIGLSPKKITVSTSGLAPKIAELGQRISVNLSVSLNAPNNALRSEIMPINRKYPIKALIDEASRYPSPTRKPVTFEYVLLGGVNDADGDSREVGELLKGIHCKVNLIPFNEAPPLPYKSPSAERVFAFQRILVAEFGLNVRIRKSRGRDILGACGQLAAAYPLKTGKSPEIAG